MFLDDAGKDSENFLLESHFFQMLAQSRERVSFHMPGHNRGSLFSDGLCKKLIQSDTTELSWSENIHRPGPKIERVLGGISSIYTSAASFLLTTGSTTGIQVMFASVVKKDSFFLLPRTVHFSVIHILSLLGCSYAFIAQKNKDEDCFLYPQLQPEELSRALLKYPQTTDVFLVSPDYYGQSADLKKLAVIVHQASCRLLVDEAHGAHFAFCPELFPCDAMRAGADICVQSLHKTLPALTMAAVLHVSEKGLSGGHVDRERIWNCISIFDTSSPSYLIATSAELSILWMREKGRRAFEKQFEYIRNFTRRCSEIFGVQTAMNLDFSKKDCLRIVLNTRNTGKRASLFQREIEKNGVFIEFSDFSRIVGIVSALQTSKDYDIFFNALCEARAGLRQSKCLDSDQSFFELEKVWRNLLLTIPQKKYSLRDALLFQDQRTKKKLEDSAECIAAEVIAPYPPGIPLLWPGEKITWEHVSFLSKIQRAGIEIHGLHKGHVMILEESTLGM